VPNSTSATITDEVAALSQVPQRIIAAWADNDADAFASVFTEDATLILPNDIYLTSREEIRSFMAGAFTGPYQGTKVFGQPLSVRSIGGGVAVVITRGGVLKPGETEVSAEEAIRATWVVTKQSGEWLIAAYQNTPIGT
jgi:uncharacterized protein (TIGR02246 family)